uniref:Uncharacterized protein n=1 Tax=Arion vulgaris TaxID=1028688 RepID=A0A0B6ZI07_9EUPU
MGASSSCLGSLLDDDTTLMQLKELRKKLCISKEVLYYQRTTNKHSLQYLLGKRPMGLHGVS